ncbi:MAG: hypothetical protein JWO30_1385 [Fibrobacteres bacterium]|nr:hypothetical protein [Fibrobacterota bacterium]
MTIKAKSKPLQPKAPLSKRLLVLCCVSFYLFLSIASTAPSLHRHPCSLDGIGSGSACTDALSHAKGGAKDNSSSDSCALCHWQSLGMDAPQRPIVLIQVFHYSPAPAYPAPQSAEQSAFPGGVSSRGPPRFSLS